MGCQHNKHCHCHSHDAHHECQEHHEPPHCDHHCHCHDGDSVESSFKRPLISLGLLILIGCVQYFFGWWNMPLLRSLLYVVAFVPVGLPVLAEAWELLRHERNIFNECVLMSIASIGAFAIGEEMEAVLLMLLYQVGEYLQGKAVAKARKDIAELADVRSDKVLLVTDEETREIKATEAKVGDTLRVIPGMRVSLDGKLLSEEALLDLSALTGESMLVERERGEEILAGSLVSGRAIEMEVTKPYADSTLAHIIQMTEEATERKPQTERFIRRFAKVYTPIVFGLALLVVLVPWVVSLMNSGFEYIFTDWLYKALVFLVVSCPCALVISVPLTYFSGMGALSRHGLLFKGALYMEELRRVTAIVFDKTGTLTEGHFEVKEVLTTDLTPAEALAYLAAMEAHSSHPMAKAIQAYTKGVTPCSISQLKEEAGMGLSALSETGVRLLAGSERMMLKEGVEVPEVLSPKGESAVLLAVDGKLKATITLCDKVKGSSRQTVEALNDMEIAKVVMLSGDKTEVAQATAVAIGIEDARGGLLPHDKMEAVEELMREERVAFVGDGLNDAPVMSMSHVGIAMGGIASDATIEAADIVIQGEDPYKVLDAIEIARHTHKIVIQNIIFALGFKLLVMILAVAGYASLWLAVVADVGVTLLAVLNALRALNYNTKTIGDNR